MTELEMFQMIGYIIFMFGAVAYAALDGFDLGVGCLHLFAKGDEERRTFINAIGPIWDGNSVWIVVTSGVLLAAFPIAFATLLPTFYLPVMFLLAGFMFRACAIEFRSKRKSQKWRTGWDYAFAISSIMLALALGAMLGNLIYGFPLDNEHELIASEHTVFHPYSILVCFFALSAFMLHGCMFLIMKTQGTLQKKLQTWVIYLMGSFLIFWTVTTVATFFFENHMVQRFEQIPWFVLVCPSWCAKNNMVGDF
jgi:cytochrome d ubiquinol oxidase subunit II